MKMSDQNQQAIFCNVVNQIRQCVCASVDVCRCVYVNVKILSVHACACMQVLVCLHVYVLICRYSVCHNLRLQSKYSVLCSACRYYNITVLMYPYLYLESKYDTKRYNLKGLQQQLQAVWRYFRSRDMRNLPMIAAGTCNNKLCNKL